MVQGICRDRFEDEVGKSYVTLHFRRPAKIGIRKDRGTIRGNLLLYNGKISFFLTVFFFALFSFQSSFFGSNTFPYLTLC